MDLYDIFNEAGVNQIEMKKVVFILCLTAVLSMHAAADPYADCEAECAPPKSCESLIEGRISKMRCLDSCRQRKAWENLTVAVQEFALSLTKRIETLSLKIDRLEKRIEESNIDRNPVSELNDNED